MFRYGTNKIKQREKQENTLGGVRLQPERRRIVQD